MDVFFSSWLVLTKEWNGILSLLCILLLGGGIVFLWLKAFLGESITSGEYFVLSLGGALFPLSLSIFIALLLNYFSGIKVNFIIICLLMFIMSCFAVYRISEKKWFKKLPSLQAEYKRISSEFLAGYKEFTTGLVLLLIFLGSLYVRLAFISGLITPLYFDSATHYSIIQGFSSKIENSSLATVGSLVEGYYHLGYHAILASTHLALNLDVSNTMLLFGQIVLALIPLPMFFIIKQETRMDVPGIFAVLLASWGWSMPAYSLNWGKYPALTSILPFEFILCSIYLVVRSPKRYRWILAGFSGFCLLVSIFIHTRSVILVAIAITSSAFGLVWTRSSKLIRAIILAITGVGLAVLIYLVQSKLVLSFAFQPYREDGRWMLLLVLLLFPFALNKFPTATFSGVFSLLLLLGSLFISVNQFIPGNEIQTLLDRPYVEMILFFPLAFLGGLGYAGLLLTMRKVTFFPGIGQNWISLSVTLLLFGALAVNTAQYKFLPSDCCQFFVEDDAVALDWMDKHLPADMNILVASEQAFILETQSPTSFSGTDGGIWINPLIHRNPLYINYQTDFSQQSTLADLCKNKVTYIYIGGTEESFDLLELQERPDWYEALLLLPKAQVFRVAGCQ